LGVSASFVLHQGIRSQLEREARGDAPRQIKKKKDHGSSVKAHRNSTHSTALHQRRQTRRRPYRAKKRPKEDRAAAASKRQRTGEKKEKLSFCIRGQKEAPCVLSVRDLGSRKQALTRRNREGFQTRLQDRELGGRFRETTLTRPSGNRITTGGEPLHEAYNRPSPGGEGTSTELFKV